MPEIIHPSGLREVVPTRKEMERRILDQFGLDAIRMLILNQRAIALAISSSRSKKTAKLELAAHPIEQACEQMDAALRLIAERMESDHA